VNEITLKPEDLETTLDKMAANNIFILKNGMYLLFDADKNIIVDVNGKKQPNTVGKDIYYFKIKEESSLAKDNVSFVLNASGDCDDNWGTPAAQIGCAAKLLEKGKIDWY